MNQPKRTREWRALVATLAFAVAAAGCGPADSRDPALAEIERRCLAEAHPSVAPESVTLPSLDGGRLALVVHGAGVRSARGPVFVIDSDGQRRIALEAASFVRFLDAGRLLVSGTEDETRGDRQSAVFATDGRRIEALATERLGSIEPSPDGSRFVATQWPAPGTADPARLVVRSLRDPTRDLASRPLEGREERAFWSPAGDRLAIDRIVVLADPERASARRLGRELRIGAPSLGASRALDTGSAGEPAAIRGVRVLGWTQDGIFGELDRTLVRCDPGAGGCARVARFDDDGRPVGFAAGPPGTVYVTRTEEGTCSRLLPNVHRALAHRLERVDLADGRVEPRIAMPPGLAIGDFDWVPSPGADRAESRAARRVSARAGTTARDPLPNAARHPPPH